MALEESRFFDSVENDNSYYADDFAEYFRMFLKDGVWKLGENLSVSPGNGLSVTIDYGAAMVQGYGYWLKDNNTGKKQLNLASTTAQQRIDRIVLRLDTSLQTRKITLAVLTGEAAAQPVAPDLTRSGNVYEVSLARVHVGANALSVLPEQIVDERADSSLCGVVEPRAVSDYLDQGVKTSDSPTFEKVTANIVIGAVYQ
ncbi:hypothetical protein AALG83_06120 [Christensenellaceae bacterium 44-20]